MCWHPRFSVTRAVQTLTRASLTDDHARDEILLLSTVGQTPATDDLLAKAAAQIWSKIWSPPHRYPDTRRPPKKGNKTDNTGSLKAYFIQYSRLAQ